VPPLLSPPELDPLHPVKTSRIVITAALVILLLRVAIPQKLKLSGITAIIPSNRIDASPSPLCAQNLPAGRVPDVNRAADEAVVVTVTVAVGLFFPPGVSKEGEIVHRVPGGIPAQDNVIFWLKPPSGININENVAIPPALTVIFPGDPNKVKLWPVPGETTVTVVEPQISPAQALTVDDPTATPKRTPLLVESFVMPLLLPESFVTVTTVLSEELQIAEASVCVLLSLNVPTATRA
jgi:hypothetical protein